MLLLFGVTKTWYPNVDTNVEMCKWDGWRAGQFGCERAVVRRRGRVKRRIWRKRRQCPADNNSAGRVVYRGHWPLARRSAGSSLEIAPHRRTVRWRWKWPLSRFRIIFRNNDGELKVEANGTALPSVARDAGHSTCSGWPERARQKVIKKVRY